MAVALFICIPQVLRLNLRQGNGYPNLGLSLSSSVPLSKWLGKPLSLPSKFLPVHQSSVIPLIEPM